MWRIVSRVIVSTDIISLVVRSRSRSSSTPLGEYQMPPSAEYLSTSLLQKNAKSQQSCLVHALLIDATFGSSSSSSSTVLAALHGFVELARVAMDRLEEMAVREYVAPRLGQVSFMGVVDIMLCIALGCIQPTEEDFIGAIGTPASGLLNDAGMVMMLLAVRPLLLRLAVLLCCSVFISEGLVLDHLTCIELVSCD